MNKQSQIPNLLFIFTDQQAVNTIGAYGNKNISTPNLDKLASESLLFEKAYVTQPICTPSRSSILTGLYPHTNGCIENNIPLKDNTACFPETADFSKYRTGYYGKWHLGDEVFAQHGFQEWRSTEDGYYPYYSKGRELECSTYSRFLMEQGFRPEYDYSAGFKGFKRDFCASLPEEYCKPAYLAKEASHFIKMNRTKPFILFVNFLEPHPPCFGPRDNQYSPEDVVLPDNFNHELNNDYPQYLIKNQREFKEKGSVMNYPLKTEYDWKRLISNYWGLASLIDTYTGQILQTLEETGLNDNTIVVFTSDHGDMMGAHGFFGKCKMFEEAINVPLLLKIPELSLGGKKTNLPVSQIDLVPTLLNAMGKKAPEHLQGSSWYSHLKSSAEIEKKNVFVEWSEKKDIGRFIRTVITPDRWKFNFRTEDRCELYDLSNDPLETRNLAADKRYGELINELKQEIALWQKKTGDEYAAI